MDKAYDNKLDAVIKADLKLVDGEIALASAMMVLLMLAAMTMYLSILTIPALIAAVYFIYRGYRKLFYDSVFGRSSGLYQSLPIPHSHQVLSKIFAASVCETVPFLVLLVIFEVFSLAWGDGLLGGIVNIAELLGGGMKFKGDTPFQTALVLPVSVLNIIANQLAFASVIFLTVTVYQMLPQDKHTMTFKTPAIAAGWLALTVLADGVEWIFQLLKAEMPLLESGVDLVFQTVVLIVTFRMTVGLMEKHYQKG